MNNNIPEPSTNMGTPITNNPEPKTQKNKNKNIVIIISVILVVFVIAIIALFVVIFSLASSNSDKLVCKSNQGNITILYNDSTIVGYTTTGMSYDLDQQKEVANQIGIDSYISQFTTWFETNTEGTCSIEEKNKQ